MGFGVLIDNMIKELTCLHEIMSRDLNQAVILNEVNHVLQAKRFYPIGIYVYVRQAKLRAKYSWLIQKALINILKLV